MKVVFLADYFYPFIHGGAETSISLQAQGLINKGLEVFLLTPNYGASKTENYKGIKISRYPFPKKLESTSAQLTPLWHFNPLYWFVQSIFLTKLVLANSIDIIHCQSVSTVIPGVIVGTLLGRPVIVSFRDSQVLCNYGVCLGISQFSPTCNWSDFWLSDFRIYYHDKVADKSPLNFIKQIVLAMQGRARCKILKYISSLTAVQVVSSRAQQKTFKANGFANTKVVANLFPFTTPPAVVKKPSSNILYATKLSSGKGLDLLLETFPLITKQFPKLRLMVVGSGDQKKYKRLAKSYGIISKISFTSHLSSDEVMKLRKKALLEVVPSVYPESFGRSALEALATGLPVVASNRGGLTDIVMDQKTGYIVEPTVKDLSKGLIRAIKYNQKLRNNILKSYKKLVKDFGVSPINKQITIYKSLV